MTTPRPLFFSDLVALDKDTHRHLSLPAERKSFAFAAQANLLPLTFAEAGQAMRHYPLVFIAEGQATALVALSGLSGGNRFVDGNGEWRPGAYIPAYVRGYPFIAIRPSEKADPVLVFDPSAADFKTAGGQPLIGVNGEPSEQLKGIMAFQGEYQQLAERTYAMTRALKEAGVLEEGNLQIQPPPNDKGGETQKIGGFLIVSEQKLKALSAEALKKLSDADALGLAYAQMFSMGSLEHLFAAPPVAQATSNKPQAAPAKPQAERSGKKSR